MRAIRTASVAAWAAWSACRLRAEGEIAVPSEGIDRCLLEDGCADGNGAAEEFVATSLLQRRRALEPVSVGPSQPVQVVGVSDQHLFWTSPLLRVDPVNLTDSVDLDSSQVSYEVHVEIDGLPDLLDQIAMWQATAQKASEEAMAAKDLRKAVISWRVGAAAAQDRKQLASGLAEVFNPSVVGMPDAWKRDPRERWLVAMRTQTMTDKSLAWYSSYIAVVAADADFRPTRRVSVLGSPDFWDEPFDCHLGDAPGNSYFGPEDARLFTDPNGRVLLLFSGRAHHREPGVRCGKHGGQRMYTAQLGPDLKAIRHTVTALTVPGEFPGGVAAMPAHPPHPEGAPDNLPSSAMLAHIDKNWSPFTFRPRGNLSSVACCGARLRDLEPDAAFTPPLPAAAGGNGSAWWTSAWQDPTTGGSTGGWQWPPSVYGNNGESLVLLEYGIEPHIVVDVDIATGRAAGRYVWMAPSPAVSNWRASLVRRGLKLDGHTHAGVGAILMQRSGHEDVYLSALHQRFTKPGKDAVPEYRSSLYTFSAMPPFGILGVGERFLPLQTEKCPWGAQVAFPMGIMFQGEGDARELWIFFGKGDSTSHRMNLPWTEVEQDYLPNERKAPARPA